MAAVQVATLSALESAASATANGNSIRLTTFDIPGASTVNGETFPLGIKLEDGKKPSLDASLEEIKTLADQGIWEELLRKNGAILFRGFPIKNATDFAAFVRAFNLPNEHQEIGLSGKRTLVTKGVKTANEEPPDVKFYFHNEYARSAHFPAVLFFFSEVVPETGGQTPIASSIVLYNRLKQEVPEFLHDLETKGIIGRQYYPAKDDPEATKIGWNWQDSFGFDVAEGDSLEAQREKAERVLARDLGAKADWQPNGALHVLQHLPAIRRLKSNGLLTFFNGLAGVYGKGRDYNALKPPHKGLNGNYHLPTLYGDGSLVPYEYLEKVLQIQEEIQFLVPWQAGDVALINNYTVQHARTPWVGKRSLLVSLWDGNDGFIPV